MAIIDKLRIVDILSPRLGERASRDFADAFQDEMEQVVLEPQLQLMLDRLMSDMDARIWRMGFTAIVIMLTALGIATGLIIALN